jgi:uncharacterized membrane protein YphA (DoxX/SURF4 family)
MTANVLYLIWRSAVGCILIYSGLVKVADMNSFVTQLPQLLARNFAPQVLALLPAFEIVLGCALLLDYEAAAVAVCCMGTFGVFFLYHSYILSVDPVARCGCLGPDHSWLDEKAMLWGTAAALLASYLGYAHNKRLRANGC